MAAAFISCRRTVDFRADLRPNVRMRSDTAPAFRKWNERPNQLVVVRRERRATQNLYRQAAPKEPFGPIGQRVGLSLADEIVREHGIPERKHQPHRCLCVRIADSEALQDWW
jgi:hypothetical protein